MVKDGVNYTAASCLFKRAALQCRINLSEISCRVGICFLSDPFSLLHML